jgi:hypothetical protein
MLTKKEQDLIRAAINTWPHDGERIEMHRAFNRTIDTPDVADLVKGIGELWRDRNAISGAMLDELVVRTTDEPKSAGVCSSCEQYSPRLRDSWCGACRMPVAEVI